MIVTVQPHEGTNKEYGVQTFPPARVLYGGQVSKREESVAEKIVDAVYTIHKNGIKRIIL